MRKLTTLAGAPSRPSGCLSGEAANLRAIRGAAQDHLRPPRHAYDGYRAHAGVGMRGPAADVLAVPLRSLSEHGSRQTAGKPAR